MAQNQTSNKPNCTIEFRVHDTQRYEILERFFIPLREYTQNHAPNSVDSEVTPTSLNPVVAASDSTQETMVVDAKDETIKRHEFARPEEWLLALRPQDLTYLGMPEHRQAIVALRNWQGLSRRERRAAIKSADNSKQLRTVADFSDMLKYWQDVEFELLELEKTDPDKASISYATFDFPFDGKVALEELLMFFGFLSILNDTC